MKFTCDTNVLVDVLRDPSAEEAFRVFLSRFSHLTYLSAVVMLELRAGARTPKQVRLLEQEVIQRFSGVNRVFAPSADAFSAAGKLLATVATREGWTAEAHPSLVHDALLAAAKWFALIGALDEDEATQFVIGTKIVFTSPRAGELTCFANDWRSKYDNNKGTVTIAVTPLSTAGG